MQKEEDFLCTCLKDVWGDKESVLRQFNLPHQE